MAETFTTLRRRSVGMPGSGYEHSTNGAMRRARLRRAAIGIQRRNRASPDVIVDACDMVRLAAGAGRRAPLGCSDQLLRARGPAPSGAGAAILLVATARPSLDS